MEKKDLGFGKGTSNTGTRFINKDGSINVFRKGLPIIRPYDLYHTLISINWLKFMVLISVSFFAVNLIFAWIYTVLENNSLSMVDEQHRFWDSFFFSVQTMTTVGYGAISPISTAAKVVSSIGSFMGLLGFALVTGLLYGRFYKTITKIRYSKNALISPFQEKNALMFKMANQRSSKLIEAEVTAVFSATIDGKLVYEDLKLQLRKINFFALSWTLVHLIDEDSVMFNHTIESLEKGDAEIVILMKAFDDSFSQTVYSRMSYKHDEFVWNAKFDSSIHNENGKMGIDLKKMDSYTKLN
ncbi:MAG: inward rectifier potassium channel [Flavobacteriales bacterium]|jgi:inward rectifier potassium channel